MTSESEGRQCLQQIILTAFLLGMKYAVCHCFGTGCNRVERNSTFLSQSWLTSLSLTVEFSLDKTRRYGAKETHVRGSFLQA